MEFILSQHTREEMAKRNIPIQILQLILNYPEQIIVEDRLKFDQGLFTANNNINLSGKSLCQ